MLNDYYVEIKVPQGIHTTRITQHTAHIYSLQRKGLGVFEEFWLK